MLEKQAVVGSQKIIFQILLQLWLLTVRQEHSKALAVPSPSSVLHSKQDENQDDQETWFSAWAVLQFSSPMYNLWSTVLEYKKELNNIHNILDNTAHSLFEVWHKLKILYNKNVSLQAVGKLSSLVLFAL